MKYLDSLNNDIDLYVEEYKRSNDEFYKEYLDGLLFGLSLSYNNYLIIYRTECEEHYQLINYGYYRVNNGVKYRE